MEIVKTFLKNKSGLIHLTVVVLLFSFFVVLVKCGHDYFSPERANTLISISEPGEPQEMIMKEFFDTYKEFYLALLTYWTRPAFWLGIIAVLLLYGWMILRLFSRYFNIFKKTTYLDLLLHPRALENIPHCLPVLFFYFLFLGRGSLNIIMMLVYVLISMPFVYKLMEDVFLTAEREGTVELYLNKRKKNRALMVEFLRKRAARLVIIPVLFLIMLMVYWDFLYAGIAVYCDDASAPAVFYKNFNNESIVGYPDLHKALILFHIGLLVVVMFLFLYLISFSGGKDHE